MELKHLVYLEAQTEQKYVIGAGADMYMARK